MRPRRALSATWLCLVFACLLAGCSAVRLGYANGDTITYWWLNSYVDFTDDQKPWVREDIGTFFAWHRQSQLSDYAQLLARFQQQVRGEVSAADVETDYAAIKKRAMAAVDKALPSLTRLALALQLEQIAHLEKKFASNNEKYRKEHLRGDIEDRQRQRFAKVMKQAEYWFGNFSTRQEAQIRAASDARPLDNERWMAERVRRQQELIRLLKKIQSEQPPRETVAAMLREYAQTSFSNFTYEQHKAFFDDSREGMMQMIAKIANIATPEQRAHAMKRMQKWIDDSRALAAK
jgi:hypothetical protein